MTDETNQSARCTLKTAYTIYIENVKTLEIGKDIRGIMCESMWCYQTREIIERLLNQLLLKQRTQKPVINAMMAADQEYRSSIKSAGWMPWHWEPMKDVISCEKLRVGANDPWSEDFRMGQPRRLKDGYSYQCKRANAGNWNILVPAARERDTS